MKKKTLYMHTINDAPAEYRDRNEQITFVGRFGRAKLVNSLKQIRREQQMSIYSRAIKWGFIDNPPMRYGYVKVEV